MYDKIQCMSQPVLEINIRQQSIIRALLSAHGKVTLAELAEQTGLSPRIVRYNMDVVRSWLRHEELSFINKPGYGIEIVASQELKNEILRTLNELEDCDIVLSRQQRIRIILLYLLVVEEPISTKQLVEVEEFSRSTLFKDICEVESWLNKFGLRLKRKSAKGLWIEGSEESRRFALVKLLHEELGDKNWYQISNIFLTSKILNNNNLSSRFVLFINQLELPFCRRIIQHIEENLGVSMSAISHAEIMLYLGVAILAMRIGNVLDGEIDPEIEKSDEYAIIQVIGYQIEKKFDVMPSPKEMEIISALVISNKWNDFYIHNRIGAPNYPPATKKSEKIAKEIVNICSMRLHPMLKIDQILINELSHHLDYAIFRLKHHIPFRNRNLQDLQQKYNLVYRVAESSVFILENEIENTVPPEEIGLISMYLLAALERLRTVEDSRLSVIITNDGFRSKSSLLKSRLDYEFPNLKVESIINTFDQIPKNGCQAELIISTMPLEEPPLPVIEVSPFLEVEDIKNIQRWITEKNQSKRSRNLEDFDTQNTLVDLIKLSHITLTDSAKSWQEIVQMASEPLLHNNCITQQYVNAMIYLIEHHGFYMHMGSGALLLHAKPTDGVNNLCMSMLRLSKPFHFLNNLIPDIDLVFVLGATDDNSHLTALFQLNELIHIPEFTKNVRKAKKPSEIIHLLWKWIPQLTGEI